MALSTLASSLIPCCTAIFPATISALPFSILHLRLRLRLVKDCRSVISFASSSHNQQPLPLNSEQAVLDAVAEFGVSENILPAVRTFENDLVRLTVVGAVDFQQALTAAAADGGEAADEHISSGMEAMVVETVFPGSGDNHSTVSTRLFLPARRVKEKAMKLKKSLPDNMLQGTTSKNILAMTFRQVVLQQLWSLELAVFGPGTNRNMKDLENPREVPVLLKLTASDERILSEIGEVICLAALESTKRHFRHDSTFQKLNGFFGWLDKNKQISSKDSSAFVYNFLENEILVNTRTLLEKFDLESGKNKFKDSKLENIWWTSPAFRELERVGGPQFCAWVSEYISSYMLAIDAKKFSNVKLEGWKKSDENRSEAALTHSQMISLADILDMFYEDVFTLPNKRLSCHAVAKLSGVSSNKGNSLLKAFTTALVAGVFLVTIGVMKKLYLPQLPIRNNYIHGNSQSALSDMTSIPLHSVEFSQMEEYVRIITRIKDYFGWPGEVRTNSGVCAWTGTLPPFLRRKDDADFNMLDVSSTGIPSVESDEELRSLEDIASYQVVVSMDWNIVGFQPTNRVAVNNWAGNPLAKELYGGKTLSPGLLEPGLKISPPNGVVVLELLMSLNPNSYFALIRAVDTGGKKLIYG